MASESSSSGVGFCGLLGLLFIALRLCGVIDWSWWWVLSPIWIPVLVGLVTLGTVLAGCAIVALAVHLADKRR